VSRIVCVGLLLSFFVKGQVSIPNAEQYQVNETYYYHQYAPSFAGMGGTPTPTCNNTWNIQVTTLRGKDTVFILPPSSTPYGGGLPQGTIAYKRIRWKGNSVDTLYAYYIVGTDNQLVRFVTTLPTIGRVIVDYSNYEKVMQRPLQYLTTIFDNSVRSYTITLFGAPLTFNGGCNYYGSANECGSLTVGSITENNVIKFSYHRNCTDSASSFFGTQYISQLQGGISFYSSASKAFRVNIDTVAFSVPMLGAIRDTNYEIERSLATGIDDKELIEAPVIWRSGRTIEVYYRDYGSPIENVYIILPHGGILYPRLVSRVMNGYIFELPHELPSGIYNMVIVKEGSVSRFPLPVID